MWLRVAIAVIDMHATGKMWNKSKDEQYRELATGSCSLDPHICQGCAAIESGHSRYTAAPPLDRKFHCRF
jgi:hypothetical protein